MRRDQYLAGFILIISVSAPLSLPVAVGPAFASDTGLISLTKVPDVFYKTPGMGTGATADPKSQLWQMNMYGTCSVEEQRLKILGQDGIGYVNRREKREICRKSERKEVSQHLTTLGNMFLIAGVTGDHMYRTQNIRIEGQNFFPLKVGNRVAIRFQSISQERGEEPNCYTMPANNVRHFTVVKKATGQEYGIPGLETLFVIENNNQTEFISPGATANPSDCQRKVDRYEARFLVDRNGFKYGFFYKNRWVKAAPQ